MDFTLHFSPENTTWYEEAEPYITHGKFYKRCSLHVKNDFGLYCFIVYGCRDHNSTTLNISVVFADVEDRLYMTSIKPTDKSYNFLATILNFD